ncbi:MAG: hypothetical protein CVV49_05330 [Spirochaetae bacterium HGW-Spirochaetae-5]|nr:MAG: hypothetical protein CVV49_05330 [Spirochaetae bacterium HGW-Spirochaetae-5]
MSLILKSILLVDDDRVTAKLKAKNLEKDGFNVVAVDSGFSAFNAIEELKFKFDLVLMDIDLNSGLSGIEAAEVILSKYKIPVLFLTSNSDSATAKKARSVSFYGYIPKDARHYVLVEAIEMAIELNKILLMLGSGFNISKYKKGLY